MSKNNKIQSIRAQLMESMALISKSIQYLEDESISSEALPNADNLTSEKAARITNLENTGPILPDIKVRNEHAIHNAIEYFDKKCPYCGTNLFGGNSRQKMEIDHFIPMVKGGQDVPWNLVPVCSNCNRRKKDRLPKKFLSKDRYDLVSEYLAQVRIEAANEQQIFVDQATQLQRYLESLKDRDVNVDLYRDIAERVLEIFEFDHYLVDKNVDSATNTIYSFSNLLLEYLTENLEHVTVSNLRKFVREPKSPESAVARIDLEDRTIAIPCSIVGRLVRSGNVPSLVYREWFKKAVTKSKNIRITSVSPATRCHFVESLESKNWIEEHIVSLMQTAGGDKPQPL